MHNSGRLLFKGLTVIFFALLLHSCKSDPSGPNDNGTTGVIPADAYEGQFSYQYSGDEAGSVLSSTSRISSVSFAKLVIDPLNPTAPRILELSLYSYPYNGNSSSIGLMISRFTPNPATYKLSATEAGDAFMLIDSGDYHATSGTLTITSIDTVTNRISGTFEFTATDRDHPNRSITLSRGYFSKVAIYTGSYGQGALRANANGLGVTTEGDAPGKGLTGYRTYGMTKLNIIGSDVEDGTGYSFQFTIATPHAGTFQFGAPAAPATINYITGPTGSGPTTQLSSSQDKSVQGEIVLTAFDQTTHRLSGTFTFSGIDPSTGKQIVVTNGVIDNLLWFDL